MTCSKCGCTRSALCNQVFLCEECGSAVKSRCRVENERKEQCWKPMNHEGNHMVLTKGNC